MILFRILLSILSTICILSISKEKDNSLKEITHHFPDPGFRGILYDMGITKRVDKIYLHEIEHVQTLEIKKGRRFIRSLAGIEYFKHLEKFLYIRNEAIGSTRPPIEAMDSLKSPFLKELHCVGCDLKSLNLQRFKNLEILDCSYNHIDTLDISHNKKLRKLIIQVQWHANSYLKITDTLPLLQEIHCQMAEMSVLDLDKLPNLKILECSENRLFRLDCSKNYNLVRLVCDIQTTDGGRRIPSRNPSTYYGDTLSSLILPDKKTNKLNVLICYGNRLTSLDLSNSQKLDTLICFGNKIKTLDLSACKELTYVDCRDNQLQQLNLNEAIISLNCSINEKMQKLDISSCEKLKYLNCSYCSIDTLNVSNNRLLENLQCIKQTNISSYSEGGRSGSLKNIVFGKLNQHHLKEINCKDNKISRLDLQHLSALVELDCSWNKLERLNLSKNKILTTLNCSYNYIQKLNLRNNKQLSTLKCKEQGYEWVRSSGQKIIPANPKIYRRMYYNPNN